MVRLHRVEVTRERRRFCHKTGQYVEDPEAEPQRFIRIVFDADGHNAHVTRAGSSIGSYDYQHTTHEGQTTFLFPDVDEGLIAMDLEIVAYTVDMATHTDHQVDGTSLVTYQSGLSKVVSRLTPYRSRVVESSRSPVFKIPRIRIKK